MKTREKFDRVDSEGDRYRVVAVNKTQSQQITKRVNDGIKTHKIGFLPTRHAGKRMEEREIDYADIRALLSFGEHVETRCYEKRPNTMRQRFKGKDHDGKRTITCSIVEEKSIIIITVMN